MEYKEKKNGWRNKHLVNPFKPVITGQSILRIMESCETPFCIPDVHNAVSLQRIEKKRVKDQMRLGWAS